MNSMNRQMTKILHFNNQFLFRFYAIGFKTFHPSRLPEVTNFESYKIRKRSMFQHIGLFNTASWAQSSFGAWDITRVLIAFAILLQSLELFRLQPFYSHSGVWRWNTLKRDWSPWMQKILGFFLDDHRFKFILLFHFALALLLIFSPLRSLLCGVSGLLFLTHYLICLRFRGTLNGGSDTITLTVLLSLTLALSQITVLEKFGSLYLSVQITLSYFIAGWVKAIHAEWWTGHALRNHLSTQIYSTPNRARAILSVPAVSALGSVFILVFELLFPLVWVFPKLTVPFLSIAALFHLGNVYLFGLNRFFWAWISGYAVLIQTLERSPFHF